MSDLTVGDMVRVRMLGRDVETVVLEARARKGKRMEYRLDIPKGIEEALDFSDRERAYVRRSRADGGFWYYASQISGDTDASDAKRRGE